MVLEHLAGPRMKRKHDRQLARDPAQLVEDVEQQWPIDERGPMKRDEQVFAGSESGLLRGAQRSEAFLHRDEGVDHRVADEVDALGRDSLCAQVVARLVGVDEQVVAELVGDDPVDLLGHRAIEAPQPGLDVGHGTPSLAADERRRRASS